MLQVFGGSLVREKRWAYFTTSHELGGGFKHFLFSPLPGEDDPIWLIFFNKVETTN